jgi:hypothetical protein
MTSADPRNAHSFNPLGISRGGYLMITKVTGSKKAGLGSSTLLSASAEKCFYMIGSKPKSFISRCSIVCGF